MRQVVLDTETTGLDPVQGHRIIEIGCVELVNRRLTGRHFHQYLNPEREVDQGAFEVHGISNEFLADKPLFAHIAADFLEFIKGAELIIHNAPFDIGFINTEFKRLESKSTQWGVVADHSSVLDTLLLARQKRPGQRNSLDALCKAYFVDNSSRDLHGALLDAEILADVYLAMTGGQASMQLSDEDSQQQGGNKVELRRVSSNRPIGRVIVANPDELAEHQSRLTMIDKASDQQCLWLKDS
jgi:DNA polymerase-3 subunit epsilon